MRLNKIFPVTLLLLVGSMLQSCLKDQEDIFDESPSVRMQEYLDNAKKVLTSSENGWAFDYYPDRDLSYGGYIFTVKFDNANATVGSEIAPGMFETSLYKLTDDNGPMLSFDSYNLIMHFFATPSGSRYEAYDGDFEFMIMDVTDDVIRLRGKRTGNTMYLHRLDESAESYLNAATEMEGNMFATSATGTVGDVPVTSNIYLADRVMEVVWGEEEDDSDYQYYVPTKTGVRFLKPLNIAGATVDALDFNTATFSYSGVDSEGRQISLKGELAEDYAFFDEFVGDFTLYYNSGSKQVDVTLVPDKANNCFIVKGLSSAFDVIAEFNKTYGCIEIKSQQVAINGSTLIWFCAWDTSSGNLTWATQCGMFARKNLSEPGTFNFTPNDYTDLIPDSFIVWSFNGTVSSSTSAGQPSSPYVVNGSTQMPRLTKLVKKQ